VLITDPNAVIQGLANIKLESLNISTKVVEMIEAALCDNTIDSSSIILELLRD